MDTIRLWFYATMGAIVSFFTITNLIMKWRARWDRRRLHDARAYMETRHYLNDYIVDEWLQFHPYAKWLKKRIEKPSKKPTSHVRGVTNAEMDSLINDSAEFSRYVKQALRADERHSRVLSRNGYLKPPLVEHQMWHHIYGRTRHYLQYFQAQRLNTARHNVR